MICLPPHSTHFLQPLDRSFFRPLITYFDQACKTFLSNHPGRAITKLQFGALLNKAWGKAASAENAMNGFRVCGLYPIDKQAIPDYAYTPAEVLDMTIQSAETVDEPCTSTPVRARVPLTEHAYILPSTSAQCRPEPVAMRRFDARRQEETETLAEYEQSLRTRYREAWPNATSEQKDLLLKRKSEEGLASPDMAQYLRLHAKDDDFSATVLKARHFADVAGAGRQKKVVRILETPTSDTHQVSMVNHPPPAGLDTLSGRIQTGHVQGFTASAKSHLYGKG